MAASAEACIVVESDPRFVGARRLRALGRHEAAVRLLSDLLLASTEGKSEAEQQELSLAPLYYEYGCALLCASREIQEPEAKRQRLTTPEPEKEAAAEEEEAAAEEQEQEEPKEEEEAQEEEEEGEEEEEEEDEDDLSLAWKMLDQARCIYEKHCDENKSTCLSGVARCCVQLGDLNRDQEFWGDAIVEYDACVDAYERRGEPFDLKEKIRTIASLVGAATAYLRHPLGEPIIAGADIVVAEAHKVDQNISPLLAAAQAKLNALLVELANKNSKKEQQQAKDSEDICHLTIELQAALDLHQQRQQNNISTTGQQQQQQGS